MNANFEIWKTYPIIITIIVLQFLESPVKPSFVPVATTVTKCSVTS